MHEELREYLKLMNIITLKAIFYMTIVRLIFEGPFLRQFSFIMPVLTAIIFIWSRCTMPPLDVGYVGYLLLMCFATVCAWVFKHPYADHEIYPIVAYVIFISIVSLFEVFHAILSHMRGDD